MTHLKAISKITGVRSDGTTVVYTRVSLSKREAIFTRLRHGSLISIDITPSDHGKYIRSEAARGGYDYFKALAAFNKKPTPPANRKKYFFPKGK